RCPETASRFPLQKRVRKEQAANDRCARRRTECVSMGEVSLPRMRLPPYRQRQPRHATSETAGQVHQSCREQRESAIASQRIGRAERAGWSEDLKGPAERRPRNAASTSRAPYRLASTIRLLIDQEPWA